MMDEWMDGWMDGWIDRYPYIYFLIRGNYRRNHFAEQEVKKR